ncbi:hypothetical protein [Massilia putida]|uniref:hypothetical protein n=1 Tax=Massilia putida TaxID=1141883 RepID=UPI000951C3D2|nr:hypothetical protein [Massilia putida]
MVAQVIDVIMTAPGARNGNLVLAAIVTCIFRRRDFSGREQVGHDAPIALVFLPDEQALRLERLSFAARGTTPYVALAVIGSSAAFASVQEPHAILAIFISI